MNLFESIPIDYDVSLAFIVLLTTLLTIYMAIRCFKRINVLTVTAFVLQLCMLTTGVLAVIDKVLVIPIYEIVMILLGVLIPSGFLVADYMSMKKRIRNSNADVPLIQRIEKPSNKTWKYEDFIRIPNEWKAEYKAGVIASTLPVTDKQLKTNITQQLSAVHKLIDSQAYKQALDIYLVLSGLLDDHPLVAYNTAWLCHRNGLFEDAVKYYKKALYVIGEEHGSKGSKKGDILDKAEHLRSVIYFGYGLSLYALEQYELAIHQFQLALKETDIYEAHVNIARCYIAAGKLDEARDRIKAALKTREDNKLRYLLAHLCYELKQEMECKYQLETIVSSDPDFTEAWSLLGTIYRSNGDWKNACVVYKKLTELTPHDADVYYRLGVAQRQEEKTDDALASFKFATDLMPDHSRALYSMASIYDAYGKTDKAIECLEKSLNGNEKLEMAYSLLAEIYISNDKVREAIRIYEEGAREHPESYLIHYNLGISLMMMKRYEEAVRIFKRAHKITDDDPALYYNWASAVIGLKNYSEAARLYKEGLKLKSDDDEILFGLARVSALSGDAEAALGFLAKAIELNPDLRLRAKASHDFAAYRTMPDFMAMTKIPAREDRKNA